MPIGYQIRNGRRKYLRPCATPRRSGAPFDPTTRADELKFFFLKNPENGLSRKCLPAAPWPARRSLRRKNAMAALRKLMALAVVGGSLATPHAWSQSRDSHSAMSNSMDVGSGGAQSGGAQSEGAHAAGPFSGGFVSGGDAEPIQMPRKPVLAQVKHLINPSVADIQNAIEPGVRIDITGSVNASDGRTLKIEVDDVRLNFKRAATVAWSGSDTWDGFLNISGRRVEVVNLRLEVQGDGRCRGVVLLSPASDVRINKCAFRNTADG